MQLDQSSAMSYQSVADLYVFLSCLVQPDTTTGDIVFVLQLKENAKFKRKGDDLFVEHTLSLTEALCGFQFPLTHLDGRQLLIKSSPGEIVKSGNCFPHQFPRLCWLLPSREPVLAEWLWCMSQLD